MKQGLSTGKPTIVQQRRMDAIKGVGCTFCHHTSLMPDDMRAELWEMAGMNRRVA